MSIYTYIIPYKGKAKSEVCVFLFNIILLLRSLLLPLRHFCLSNRYIYIHCSLLQESLDSCEHLVLIYIMFQELIQSITDISNRTVSVAAFLVQESRLVTQAVMAFHIILSFVIYQQLDVTGGSFKTFL